MPVVLHGRKCTFFTIITVQPSFQKAVASRQRGKIAGSRFK